LAIRIRKSGAPGRTRTSDTRLRNSRPGVSEEAPGTPAGVAAEFRIEPLGDPAFTPGGPVGTRAWASRWASGESAPSERTMPARSTATRMDAGWRGSWPVGTQKAGASARPCMRDPSRGSSEADRATGAPSVGGRGDHQGDNADAFRPGR